MLIQYFYWLKALFKGKFGWSLRYPNRSASELFSTFLPNSLWLIIPSITLSLIVSVLIGVKAACSQNSRFDRISMTLSSLGLSIPPHWLAILAIMIFCIVPYRSFGFSLFPAGNIISFGKPFAGSFWDRIWRLALPVLVLSAIFIANWTRYIRSSFLEVIRSDFIRTARAKRVPERRVIWGHALRNALIPLVTTVAGSIPWVFTWTIVVEAIFTYPGLCRLFYVSFFYPTDISVLQMVIFSF
jgi:peptide/nickel transport system permease protein